MDLTQFLIQLPTMGALVTMISEFVSKWIQLDGWLARLQTWVIGFGLVFLSDYVTFWDINMFTNLDVVTKIFYGIFIGLVANGIFTIDQIKQLLEKLGIRTYTPSLY